MNSPKLSVQFMKIMCNTSVSAKRRAETLAYLTVEHGLDIVPGALECLVIEADEGRELKAKKEEEDRNPLSPERFIGRFDEGLQPMAIVTTGQTDCYLPCRADEIEGLECGDSILLDVRNACVVGRNGHSQATGDIAIIDSLPNQQSKSVIVKHEDRKRIARLPQRLIDRKES